ncbi:MAG: YkgJ family cysteine cluster protein [Bacillota bacterium]
MQNYQGKEVEPDTKSLFTVREELTELTNKWQSKKLTKITRNELFKMMDELYELEEQVLVAFDDFIACGKGCSNCCRKLIYLTELEGARVKEYIIDHLSTSETNKIISRLKKREELKQEMMSNGSVGSYLQEGLDCVCLSESGLCNIYPARPWDCRLEIVFSDPKYCQPTKEKEAVRLSNTEFSAWQDLLVKLENKLEQLNQQALNDKHYTLEGYLTAKLL